MVKSNDVGIAEIGIVIAATTDRHHYADQPVRKARREIQARKAPKALKAPKARRAPKARQEPRD